MAVTKGNTKSQQPDPPEEPPAEQAPHAPGKLLEASYHEMLNGCRLIYARTGDLGVKEIVDRAEYALSLFK